MKPVWGLLTDIFTVNGYHRRPYFVISGILGVVSALSVALVNVQFMPAFMALICLIGVTASMAIADVTIDACIAKIVFKCHRWHLICRVFVVFAPLLGFFIYESRSSRPSNQKVRIPRICWDDLCNWCSSFHRRGSNLPQLLKDYYSFRKLLFFAQLLYGFSGMLDLTFVLRWNLKLGIPDYFFVIFEECVSRIVNRLRWMPMIVLSTKLCPLGIEGTFFALLMCIDSLGQLSSKWSGGLVLHLFHVTRSDFTNLWLVMVIKNAMFSTLALIFLVPKADQYEVLVPPDLLKGESLMNTEEVEEEEETIQLVAMNEKMEAVEGSSLRER
ncbi:hypothetical protein MKW92_041851 [Papaver armeniacum]|nr:hypothetical protein MKW92_041851 [Papaver armeniacum]